MVFLVWAYERCGEVVAECFCQLWWSSRCVHVGSTWSMHRLVHHCWLLGVFLAFYGNTSSQHWGPYSCGVDLATGRYFSTLARDVPFAGFQVILYVVVKLYILFTLVKALQAHCFSVDEFYNEVAITAVLILLWRAEYSCRAYHSWSETLLNIVSGSSALNFIHSS